LKGETGHERLIMLSDGVFAFSMTLMVLTIDVPKLQNVAASDMPSAVLDQSSELLSYAISLLVVGLFWAEPHRLFRYIERHAAGLIRLNICFLLCVSFLPFPTDLAEEYAERAFAVVFYATSMVLTSPILFVLWRYAS
jgi:uncharacterized membrane protein